MKKSTAFKNIVKKEVLTVCVCVCVHAYAWAGASTCLWVGG